jgi:hypothetical protein
LFFTIHDLNPVGAIFFPSIYPVSWLSAPTSEEVGCRGIKK